MRVVIQRVSKASVEVKNSITGKIDRGLLLLIGIEETDGRDDIEWTVKKISGMRIFGDQDGKMNLSIQDVGGKVLAVSQFTLHASTKKGTRPSFIKAARPEVAEPLYNELCNAFERTLGVKTERGVFGAMMQIDLVNDGPVTILLDTKNKE